VNGRREGFVDGDGDDEEEEIEGTGFFFGFRCGFDGFMHATFILE
jgi:hypothetical protein